MKGFLRAIFNFFWILLVGIPMAIANAVAGIVRCVTIIFIPFGIQNFKFIKLVFAPAGKRVIKRFSSHPVMNVLWFIFGGFITWLLNILLGLIFLVTLIGIPVGLQLFKLAAFQLAPFGAEIVKVGEYTKDKKTLYDFKLLQRKLYADPFVVIDASDGKPFTAADYLCRKRLELQLEEKRIRDKSKAFLIVAVVLWVISGALGVLYMLLIYPILYANCVKKPLLTHYRKYYLFLTQYYPNEARAVKKVKIQGSFIETILPLTMQANAQLPETVAQAMS